MENQTTTVDQARCATATLAIFVAALFVASGAVAATVPFVEHTIEGGLGGARSIYATDVDGDGDGDVLGAAFDADTIAWWENTAGDGSAWTEHTIDGAFDGANTVYAADVDGDGDTDVLGVAFLADDITWWENTAGDGSAWTEHTIDGSFNGAFSVHAADVDGDGDTDVLGAAHLADDITWWENTAGDGSAWTEHTINGAFDGPRSVYAADVDGDGDTDVLGAASIADDITWWENTAGDGSAWSEHTVNGAFDGAFSIHATDLDGDGDTDVLGAGTAPDAIRWWENDGSVCDPACSWPEHTIDGLSANGTSVYAADVDGDGDADVLGAGSTDDDIAWWENTAGDGSVWSEHTIDAAFDGAFSVYAMDVDGDGDTDVLGAANNDNDITWWENETIHRSALYPAEHTIDAAFLGGHSVYATDVDGDGDTDVLAASDRDVIAWWQNTAGDGSAWTKHTVDEAFDAAAAVYAADVDGDGDTDVLGAAFLADEITWWENTAGDGSTWSEQTIDGTFDGAWSVFAADVDGDGDTDVLGAGSTDDDITWWENTAGDGSAWTEHTIDAAFDGARSVYAADVDGDGDTDVLGAAVVADDITWWENTAGDGSSWTEHTIDGAFNNASSVYSADVDGDGDADVLGAATIADDIAWWENTVGDGSAWTEHTIEGAFFGATAVYAADVDGDGDTDVLGAAQGGEITWWENTAGNGSVWTERTIVGGLGLARSVYAADLDGDGQTDVLGAGSLASTLPWWKNQGGQFALPTVDVAPGRAEDGGIEAALEIDATHRGRFGDSDAELVTLELLLTDALATPLTDMEADNLFVALSVYLDDGSGTFEPGTDTEVNFVTSFPLTAGVLTVPFADDDPNAQFAQGAPKKYFIVAEFESDASQQSPDDVQLTHITEASSTGEDAANDIPISLELSSNVASTAIEVNDLPVAVDDAFTLGIDHDLDKNVLEDHGSGADSDEEGDALTASLVTPPTLGTLLAGLGADGSFTYEPGATGIDTFTYLANDGFGDSNIATVTINVTDAVPPPVPVEGHTVDGAFGGAISVYAADVDGDGDTDLLGAALGANEITWWENTAGDGSGFTEHTIDSAFVGAFSVYAADVDGDGDTDVLGAASGDSDITWWENTAGDGSTWSEHTIEGSFGGAHSVYAADVDGDGDNDVLGAAITADDITWWENTAGDGLTWSEHTIEGEFDGAHSVYAADVDGDGDTDVLGAAVTADDITWWENTAGDGSTWSEHTIDGDFDGAISVYATDVDGDGDTDVLGAADTADDITWWENTAGDGLVWSQHTIDGAFDVAAAVFATDVDGDGDTDVLGAAFSADDITWWENTSGDGSAWTEQTIDGAFDGAAAVYATDVDGDGDTDVLGAANNAGEITWWENETIHRSAVHPTEHLVGGTFNGAISVHAADVDGDGDTDLLGAALVADDVTWWENSAGDGSTWTEHTIDGAFDGPWSILAADVDGDGDTDVLGAARNADDITWWENTAGDGSAWSEHTIDTAFDAAVAVSVADVDGDGDTDVLGAAATADDITWWENTAGDGLTWSEHTIDGSFDGAQSVYAADVDGDGDTDVLGAAVNADDITWWENTAGDGLTWSEHTIDGDFDGAFSVYATDVDGDGDTDVLGAADSADDITWWENTAGDGLGWSEHTIDGAFDVAAAVYATDVDGDGDTDVLGAAFEADDITWWENTAGDGSAWTKQTIDGAFDGAAAVYATDVDGDGDADVLGAANNAGEITWWENQGGQFALPTANVAPSRVEDGVTEAALEVDATHRGRSGDSDAELVTLELLLTDAAATPLTDTQADDLFVALSVYLDDGSGTFDPGTDTEVTFVTSFPLTVGVLSVPFADDDPDAQFAQGAPKKYFVVAEFEPDASAQTPDDVVLTHITEASSTGEDAANDLPISLELLSNTPSSAIEVNDVPVAIPDEFMIVKNNDLDGNVLADNGFGADSDEENDTLTTLLNTPPSQGTLLGGLGTDGSFTYQPDPDATGIDTFTYLANDGLGDSNIATVTITVNRTQIFTDGFESGDTSAWSTTVP